MTLWYYIHFSKDKLIPDKILDLPTPILRYGHTREKLRGV